VLRTARQTIEIDVGARESRAVAEKIRNPKSRLDKLGVKAGLVVSIVGRSPTTTSKRNSTIGASKLSKGRAGRAATSSLWRHKTRDPGTTRSSEVVAASGRRDLGRAAQGCGDITEAQVMQAAKAAGSVDTKVVKFSETLTAEKVVIPSPTAGNRVLQVLATNAALTAQVWSQEPSDVRQN